MKGLNNVEFMWLVGWDTYVETYLFKKFEKFCRNIVEEIGK